MNPSPLSPLPGGWYGSEMTEHPELWRVPLPDDVRDDLLRAAADLPDGASEDPLRPRPGVSESTRTLVAELYRRLAGEPGLVVLTGFPVHEEPKLTERAYLLLGMLLGQPIRQRLDPELLETIGISTTISAGAPMAVEPGPRPFHVDRATDLIGLLCIRNAQIGGRSLIVSSRTVHNVLLERHPDMLSVLYEPMPVSVSAAVEPDGERPERWCEIPVFSRVDGHFTAYYGRGIFEYSQTFSDAPRFTEEQKAALAALDEVTGIPDLQLVMDLQPGDLQLINNLAVLHSRTAYEHGSPGQGRLLLRLHLAFAGSAALPDEYAEVFGATGAGTYRGGLWRTAEFQSRFGVPLQPA